MKHDPQASQVGRALIQQLTGRREAAAMIQTALGMMGVKPRTIVASGADPYRLHHALAHSCLCRMLAEDGAGHRSVARLLREECDSGRPPMRLMALAAGAAVQARGLYQELLGNEERIEEVLDAARVILDGLE